jgi:predicted HAD superfamily Cof-like phosphohydrolase
MTDPQAQLYMSLIQEEFDETMDAFVKGDTIEVADGLADMVWVIMGLASSLGIPFDQVWDEVRASNMSKVVDGKLIKREDGKVLKPEGYFRPDINAVLFW